MHSLSRLSRIAQWSIALLLGALYLLLIIPPIVSLAGRSIFWFSLMFLISLPFVAILESLLLTPLYSLAGRFRYHSPMLLSTRSGEELHLHVGTNFDYVTQLRWTDRGVHAQRTVLGHLLRGLIRICDEVEAGHLAPATAISATSYFFSDRSAQRLGFRTEPAAGLQLQNLLVSFLSIALRLSFTHGRLRWPDLRQARRIGTTAAELLARRPEIERMLAVVARERLGTRELVPKQALQWTQGRTGQ